MLHCGCVQPSRIKYKQRVNRFKSSAAPCVSAASWGATAPQVGAVDHELVRNLQFATPAFSAFHNKLVDFQRTIVRAGLNPGSQRSSAGHAAITRVVSRSRKLARE